MMRRRHISNIEIEHGHSEVIYSLSVLMFHSYVNVYQRVRYTFKRQPVRRKLDVLRDNLRKDNNFHPVKLRTTTGALL